jgi:hypothetical protein
MSDELEFMQTLGEARMFRTRNQIAGAGARSLTDHLFVSLMSLYAMSNDYNYAPVAKAYARRTIAMGGFNRPSPSSPVLYQTIYSIQRPGEMFTDEKDTMLMGKVRIDTPKIKQFLQKIKSGNMNPATAQQFFFKLEKDLKIQDPKLRAARRLTQDWTKLSTQQQQLVTTQLMRYFRMSARRSDLMPLYSKFAKDKGLEISDKKKSSIGNSLAKGAAAFAVGYAIGKAIEI